MIDLCRNIDLPSPGNTFIGAASKSVKGMLRERFELVEEYIKESHFWQYLLKCRECGQLYFFQFCEEIDWGGGDDPQYTRYIPVNSAEDGALLSRYPPRSLLFLSPSLCVDFPREFKTPAVY
jgi:hypothetical protein